MGFKVNNLGDGSGDDLSLNGGGSLTENSFKPVMGIWEALR